MTAMTFTLHTFRRIGRMIIGLCLMEGRDFLQM